MTGDTAAHGDPARVEANARALMDIVDEYRRRECDRVLSAARHQASSLLRQARADARAIAQRAFDEARQRGENRIAAATAEAATRRRVVEQHRLSALLSHGVRSLPDMLAQRWSDTAPRGQWVAHVVNEARRRLPVGAWQIRYAPGLNDAERDALGRTLDGPPAFTLDRAMRGGLCIGVPPNVIDGSLEGLLADRSDVEAQLLVELAPGAGMRVAEVRP